MSIFSVPLVQLLLQRIPGIGLCFRQTTFNQGRDSGDSNMLAGPALKSISGTLIFEAHPFITGNPLGKLNAPMHQVQCIPQTAFVMVITFPEQFGLAQVWSDTGRFPYL